MIKNQNEMEAANAFTDVICNKLATDRGVHAETAISAISRMAGTMLLRSSGLPINNLKSGSPVFADVVNEQGEELLGTVGKTLASLRVPFDPSKLTYEMPAENAPHLNLEETQAALNSPFREVLSKYRMTEQEGAQAAAVSAGMLIEKCAAFLDPHVSYTIAAYGIIEACKTVPWVN